MEFWLETELLDCPLAEAVAPFMDVEPLADVVALPLALPLTDSPFLEFILLVLQDRSSRSDWALVEDFELLLLDCPLVAQLPLEPASSISAFPDRARS